MSRPKRKADGLEERFSRIRKPVPPPTRVEKDRRRKIKEEQLERDLDTDDREDDE